MTYTLMRQHYSVFLILVTKSLNTISIAQEEVLCKSRAIVVIKTGVSEMYVTVIWTQIIGISQILLSEINKR